MIDSSHLSRVSGILPPSVHRVIELLEGRNLEHWIDSGTLLGIVRDGRLIPGDMDIDLGVAVESEDVVEAFVENLRSLDRPMNIRTWHGRIFKVKMYPNTTKGDVLDIDLNFFRCVGNERVCPSIRQRVVRARGLKKTLGPKWKRLVKTFFERTQYRLDVAGRFSDLWLYKETWWFPELLVLPTQTIVGGPCRTPGRIEDYLAFRYGDWRTPRSDWNFAIHDGGFRQQRLAGFQ